MAEQGNEAVSASKQPVPVREFLKRHEGTLGAARRVGNLTVTNITVFLALSAIVLYAAGLIRTMGQLQGDGIAPLRGVPLVPLQTYFVEGLAIVFSPARLVIYVVVLLGTGWLWRAAERDGLWGPVNGGVIATLVLLAGVILALLVLMPVAFWVPLLLPMGVVTGLGIFAARQRITFKDESRLLGRVAVVMFLFMVISLTALTAYLTPAPLDQALLRLQAPRGAVLSGDLISQANGLVYIATKSRPSNKAVVTAVPVSRLQTLTVIRGKEHTYRTLLEMLGIRFWHVKDPRSLKLIRDPR